MARADLALPIAALSGKLSLSEGIACIEKAINGGITTVYGYRL